MVFSDILNQLNINIHNDDVYTRSIFLGNKIIDFNISFKGTQYESIGLYLLVGKYEAQKDNFSKLYIECDFGFLCYVKANSKVRINVVSNNIPLLRKVSFPFASYTSVDKNIKYYDELDLSLYDSMLLCNNIQNNKTIADLIKYHANNVYIVDDTPYQFNLYCLDKNVDSNVIDNISNLSFYMNNMISIYSKQITFYMYVQSRRFITFRLSRINSIADLENNIKTCLNYYVPKLLSLNVWNDKSLGINFRFKFGSYINVDNLNIHKVEALGLLSNVYNSFIPIFNVITDFPINITIESYDRKESVINGVIYPSGLVTTTKK